MGLGGYGSAPVEEFPGPEEMVRMEPQDQMSEGEDGGGHRFKGYLRKKIIR